MSGSIHTTSGAERSRTAWRDRVSNDRERADALLTRPQRYAVDEVTRRALVRGARAVVLTGSTVRGSRTPCSDLDLMIVGHRPDLSGIEEEVDVYAVSSAQLAQRLREDDDYIPWTLRFGCVLHDDGVLRAAALELETTHRWPSADRKLGQARRLLRTASLVVDSGDEEAAIEQCRAVLTTTARWFLLARKTLPLSRAELPRQLAELGERRLADALEQTIYGGPSLEELRGVLRTAESLLPNANEHASPDAAARPKTRARPIAAR